MKISVSSYSFFRLMKNDGVTQKDCISLAKELGYDGIEFSGILAPEGMTETEYARVLAEEAKKQGMPISNYCVGANLAKEPKELDEEIERIKKQVDIAAVLGVSTMRHDAFFDLGPFRSFYHALPTVAGGCRAITQYAEQKGIKTMVENHGLICQEADRLEALCQAVDHPNFGILGDMGNFLCGDCEPAEQIGKLSGRLFLAHAKDFIVKPADGLNPGEGFFRSRCGNYLRGTIIGHGQVPVAQCMFILKRIGYDGWLSVEFEGMEDVMTALKIDLENLRRYMA